MDAVAAVMSDVSRAHFQHVVNRVGPITEAELDARIAEAAQIHAREWARSPHPLDHTVPAPLHDWAIRHIAANLVALDRGVRIGHGWEQPTHLPERPALALIPAARAGEE